MPFTSTISAQVIRDENQLPLLLLLPFNLAQILKNAQSRLSTGPLPPPGAQITDPSLSAKGDIAILDLDRFPLLLLLLHLTPLPRPHFHFHFHIPLTTTTPPPPPPSTIPPLSLHVNTQGPRLLLNRRRSRDHDVAEVGRGPGIIGVLGAVDEGAAGEGERALARVRVRRDVAGLETADTEGEGWVGGCVGGRES